VARKVLKSKVKKKNKNAASGPKSFAWGFAFATLAIGLINLVDYFEIQQGKNRMTRIASRYLAPWDQAKADPVCQKEMRKFDCFMAEVKGAKSLHVDSRTVSWVVAVGHLLSSQEAMKNSNGASKDARFALARLDSIELTLWGLEKVEDQPRVPSFSPRYLWKRESGDRKRFIGEQWGALARLWKGMGTNVENTRSLASVEGSSGETGAFHARKKELLGKSLEFRSRLGF
jgi:hypothetical protein